MTDMPPVNPSGVPLTSTDSIMIESVNKKIGTSESISTEHSISTDHTMPTEAPPSDRDQKIIDAFFNQPPDGVSVTTTEAVPTSATPTTTTTTASSPTDAVTTDSTTGEETEAYSQQVTFLLASPFVQNSPSATAAIEEDPDKADQGLDTFMKQNQNNKKDLESAQDSAQAALDSYKVPEAGTDTQSSKYSGS